MSWTASAWTKPSAPSVERRAKDALAACADFEGGYRSDFSVGVGHRARGEVAEEERDRLFAANDLFLAVIDKFSRGSRRIGSVIGKLFDDFAQVRILAAERAALGPNADLTAAVATEDEAILNEGNVQRLAGGGNGRCDAGVTAADHDKVELAGIFGLRRQAEPFLAERGEVFVGRGLEVGIVAQQDRIAAAVETGQVVQRER